LCPPLRVGVSTCSQFSPFNSWMYCCHVDKKISCVILNALRDVSAQLKECQNLRESEQERTKLLYREEKKIVVTAREAVVPRTLPHNAFLISGKMNVVVFFMSQNCPSTSSIVAIICPPQGFLKYFFPTPK